MAEPAGTAPTASVGWRLVPDEPAGTLGWWDGDEFVAFAVWTSDHWVYVTETWSGPDPPPGELPDGAGDPRTSGWWRAPDGTWHWLHPPGPPPPPGLPPPPARRPEKGSLLVGVVVVVCVMMALLGTFMAAMGALDRPAFFLTDDLGNVREPHAGQSLFLALFVLPFLALPCLVVVGATARAARKGRPSSLPAACAWVVCTLAFLSGVAFVVQRQVTVKCFACTNPELGGGRCVREGAPGLMTRVPGEFRVTCPTELLQEVADDVRRAALVGGGIAFVGVVGAGVTVSLRRPSPSGRVVGALVVVFGTASLLAITVVAPEVRVTSEVGAPFRPAPVAVPIGQTQVDPAGASVTVHALDPNPSLSSFAGLGLAITVDAEVCAGPTSVTAGADEFRLSAEGSYLEVVGAPSFAIPATPGGSTILSRPNAGDTQAFPASTVLAPGSCVRGRVDFTAPGLRPERALVRFVDPERGADLRWRWP